MIAERKRGRSRVAPDISVGPPRKLSIAIAGACFIIHVVFCKVKMAASFFNRIAALGLGLAGIGGVVNTALYNGKIKFIYCSSCLVIAGRRSRKIRKRNEVYLTTSNSE